MNPTRDLCNRAVSTHQLDALQRIRPEGMVTASEAANWLSVDVRTIHTLAIYGYLPSQMADYRPANRPRRLIAGADLESFARKYIVLRALAGQRKALYTATLEFIAGQGVTPLPLREGTKPIFERRAIQRIARREGGQQLARLIEVQESRPEQLSGPVRASVEVEAGEGSA